MILPLPNFLKAGKIFGPVNNNPFNFLRDEAIIACSRYSPYHAQEIGICTDDGCLIFGVYLLLTKFLKSQFENSVAVGA